MNLRQEIVEAVNEVIAQMGTGLLVELTDDAVLLNTGMDSLGFAILVTRLESKLGYDPFTLMDEPYYPVTFGDFVRIYEQYRPN
jgi:hypothetical protein